MQALQEFLQTNKVVVFEAAQNKDSDSEATAQLRQILEQLSVTYARVDLGERFDF